MKIKTVTIWQNKTDELIQFSEKGKTKTFDTAHELIQFLQDETQRTKINIKVEQI